MTRSTALLVVLSVMGAAHFGCSASPDTAASPMDANNPPDAAVVDNDQQSITPDVPVTPDTPTPDASVDSPVALDVAMTGFDPNICNTLRSMCWALEGHAACMTIPCEMQSDGSAIARIPSNLGSEMGYSRAQCREGNSCQLTTMNGTGTDCYWRNLSPEMRSFQCICSDRTMTVVQVR